jgi:MFS family permease
MGFDTIKSQLLTVPPYVFGTICCISASVISDKFKIRGPIMVCFAGPFMIIAFIILLACENYGARYFAIFLATAGAFTGSPFMAAWMVDNSSGPMVRAIASAFNISLGSIGGLVATWTYLATDAPKYTKGHAVNLAMGVVVMIVAAAGSLNLKLENKRRDEGKRDHVLEGLTEEEIGELGHSHPNFRYTI